MRRAATTIAMVTTKPRQMMRPDINWIEVKRQLSCRDRQETGDVGILEREMRCPPCCCPR
jgi:hypothetical protein